MQSTFIVLKDGASLSKAAMPDLIAQDGWYAAPVALPTITSESGCRLTPRPSTQHAPGHCLAAARGALRAAPCLDGRCLAGLAALLEAAGPLLGKYFIDHTLVPRRFDRWEVVLLMGGMLLSGAIASVIRYTQLTRLAGVAMRSVRRLREEVYGHVLRLPMAFFDKAITGQLVSRVTNDTEQVKNLYVQVLFVMLDSSIVVLGAFVAMAWLDWHLMLIVLTLVPAVVVIVWFYQRWSAPAVTRAREKRSDINAQMSESIAGMPVLQASNAQARFRRQV
jgi:ATP-binding cassette subfamily B multidrug efflux pump